MAELLGTPLMPWQRLAADVALERAPDGSYAHKIVVISVPRQSGKTTLLRAIAVQQMIAHRRRELYYTAQTGKDARARWEQLVELIETDRSLGRRFNVRKSAGSAAIVHEGSRSRFAPFAPTAESLHGYTPHTVMIDEAFSLHEVEGRLLMGAIVPAQSTLLERQLYLVSTKGTAESTFFHDWVDAGRAGRDGVALIEYAAGDEVDVYDPDTWETFHPVAGTDRWPVVRDSIGDAALALTRSEFERAYGNRATKTAGHLVPLETWAPLRSSAKAGAGDAVALSYDVAHDLSASSIVLSWVARDGQYASRLEHRILRRSAGVEWLADAVQQFAADLAPDVVAADDGGPARSVTAELIRRGLEVETVSGTELGTAFTRWLTRLRTGQLGHDGTDEFWQAVAGIATRPMGDSTVPSRRTSAGDISAAMAAMAAGLKLEALTAPAPAPRIYVRRQESA